MQILAVPAQGLPPLIVSYLVMGGGAGGTGGVDFVNYGAGGGAGVARSGSSTLVASTSYSVTVGAGSPGTEQSTASAGSTSLFNLSSATGGYANSNSSRRGSGNADYTGGIYTGGASSGGGAGAGANGSGRSGGAGYSSSITGTSVVRGGGGGGGGGNNSGGSGGGGNGIGGDYVTAPSGQVNTGSGGGGGPARGGGGNGGSGIVILRYPAAYTITLGAGLTGSTATDGDDKVTTITAGSDNVSWA